ncbi:UNVERIFIED_CONTAM: Homeobox-leucine zipper protein MERISTEM L1 [Sesamum calycinum]|uniref:Homeobox-leucine zipper protein MERISTEM L1 n=1 Tax=Sesamum calycinum TaxID=2727403 RepID=A0AAW2Q476_9LAMI
MESGRLRKCWCNCWRWASVEEVSGTKETWHEHHKNSHFRTENDELQAENTRCREALSNACCRAYGRAIFFAGMSSNKHCLRVENARLREQIEDLSAIVAKFIGKPLKHDATIPSSTASPAINIEAPRKLKGKQKIEE